MSKRNNREVVFVEVQKPSKDRLKEAAKLLPNKDMSDIVREAIDEKLDRLARRYPSLREAGPQTV